MISYHVGTLFIPTDFRFEYETWYQNISKIGYVMLIGATIVSAMTALLIYFIVKYAVENRRKKNLAWIFI